MVIGIDPSSKTLAVAWRMGDEWGCHFYDIMDKYDPMVMYYSRRILSRLFTRLGVGPGDAVFVEAPVVAGARNIQSTIKQAFVNGVIQEVTCTHGATCTLVAPPQWKKAVLGDGHGNADKAEVASHMEVVWPELFALAKTQDELDAGAIVLYGEGSPF